MSIFGKAVLYSALIFPGSGFFILGQKRWAWSFVASAALVFSIIFIDSLVKANALSNTIIAEATHHGYVDPEELLQAIYSLPLTIRERLPSTPGLMPDAFITICTILLGIIWAAGIVCLWFKRPNSSL